MAQDNFTELHFIGIGGSGMSALAELASLRGKIVTGSDTQYSTNTERLRTLGIEIDLEQSGRLIRPGKNVVVSSAIAKSNVELRRSMELGLAIMHRSDVLKWLMEGFKVISVAGTHGKTTTSALIAHVLQDLGHDPTAAIGGVLKGIGSNVMHGKGPWFVAELDESDGSHTKFTPFIGVLTNVDQDHLDFYKHESAIHQSFSKHLNNIDSDGAAVICWDDKGSRILGSSYEGNRITYGFRLGAEVRCLSYETRGGSTLFRAIVDKDQLQATLPLMGRHNVLNALACLSVVNTLGFDVERASEALASYQGVERRMSLVFAGPEIRVYDDYAHNPGKITACLDALKDSWPDHTIHAIYQAHRYSRLETMFEATVSAFSKADCVTVLPVYAAGEEASRAFDPKNLAKEITRASKVIARPADCLEDCAQDLVESWDGPTIFITIGAGDVWKVSQRMGEILNENGAKKESNP